MSATIETEVDESFVEAKKDIFEIVKSIAKPLREALRETAKYGASGVWIFLASDDAIKFAMMQSVNDDITRALETIN